MRTIDILTGDTVMAKITTGIATAMVTSPVWLQQVSHTAAILAPILGCVWLVVQITLAIMKYNNKKDEKNGG